SIPEPPAADHRPKLRRWQRSLWPDRVRFGRSATSPEWKWCDRVGVHRFLPHYHYENLAPRHQVDAAYRSHLHHRPDLVRQGIRHERLLDEGLAGVADRRWHHRIAVAR